MIWKRLKTRLLTAAPGFLRRLLPYSRTFRRIVQSPDRQVLVEDILPAFAGACPSMLWIGVRRYTVDYPGRLEARGGSVWTTDIDPVNALWGRSGQHVTGDMQQLDRDFSPAQFDAVLCNGVFGFGVDTPEGQAAGFSAMAAVLKPGGWLMLGWNTDRTADPLASSAFAGWFEAQAFQGLPARLPVPGTTHVYDFARRRLAPSEDSLPPARKISP